MKTVTFTVTFMGARPSHSVPSSLLQKKSTGTMVTMRIFTVTMVTPCEGHKNYVIQTTQRFYVQVTNRINKILPQIVGHNQEMIS